MNIALTLNEFNYIVDQLEFIYERDFQFKELNYELINEALDFIRHDDDVYSPVIHQSIIKKLQ